MPILITKPIKAQNGAKYQFIAQPSLEYDTDSKQDPYYGISASIGEKYPKTIYEEQTDPKVKKGGVYRDFYVNKNKLYKIAAMGKGNVRFGLAPNDTIVNLDDNKIHQFDIKSNAAGNIPVSIEGLPKKKSNIHILKFFTPQVK